MSYYNNTGTIRYSTNGETGQESAGRGVNREGARGTCQVGNDRGSEPVKASPVGRGFAFLAPYLHVTRAECKRYAPGNISMKHLKPCVISCVYNSWLLLALKELPFESICCCISRFEKLVKQCAT
jgi:hypothetical protein